MSMVVNRSLAGSTPFGNARTLAQSGIPVALVSDGTVAADGTITLATALPFVYSAGVWVRLPAGAINGGASGLYWAIFSSATVGSVKTNFVDPAQPFTPYIPTGTPVAAVGSGAAYTQSSGAITVANITLPAGSLGPYGSCRVTALGSRGGSTGATNRGHFLAGNDIASYAGVGAGTAQWAEMKSFYNRGPASQVYSYYQTDGLSSSGVPGTKNVNTAQDVAISYCLGLVNTTDCIVLESIRIEIFPG